MSYTAVFRDGPLGGQFREVERADSTFRVMVPPRLDLSCYRPGRLTPEPLELPEPEVYELVGARGPMLEYRWVNPAAGLRAEVKRLRAKIDNAKGALGCS